jgi:hypothetical protein
MENVHGISEDSKTFLLKVVTFAPEKFGYE